MSEELTIKPIEQRVKEAYDKLGLKAMNGTFVTIYEDQICGCAMTALYCYSKGIELKDIRQRMQSILGYSGFTDHIANELGLKIEYVSYFVAGFDDRSYIKDDIVASLSPCPIDGENYEYHQANLEAYEDGDRTRRFLGL